ncbi:MAG: diffusible signal factor-reguated Ax21 family protein [Thermomonas sp.]
MKRSTALIKFSALALACALPFAASAADGISYNYVQGGYTRINSDANADGWAIDGSTAVTPNFHVFGGYNSAKTDNSGLGRIKLDQWKLGAGYNRAISAKTDFVGTLAYQKAEASLGGYSVNNDGYAAEAGVRAALTPMLEGYAMAGYEDGNESSGDAYGRLGAQVKFTKNWGVATDVKFASGDTQWFIGPRLTW